MQRQDNAWTLGRAPPRLALHGSRRRLLAPRLAESAGRGLPRRRGPTARSHWVLAGNYSSARNLIWPRADTLVWLDLPLPLTLWRSTARVLRQARSGEPICNGNRQTVSALVFGKDPLLWYAMKTVPARRRAWPPLLASREHAHLNVSRLTSAGAVKRWQASAIGHRQDPHVV